MEGALEKRAHHLTAMAVNRYLGGSLVKNFRRLRSDGTMETSTTALNKVQEYLNESAFASVEEVMKHILEIVSAVLVTSHDNPTCALITGTPKQANVQTLEGGDNNSFFGFTAYFMVMGQAYRFNFKCLLQCTTFHTPCMDVQTPVNLLLVDVPENSGESVFIGPIIGIGIPPVPQIEGKTRFESLRAKCDELGIDYKVTTLPERRFTPSSGIVEATCRHLYHGICSSDKETFMVLCEWIHAVIDGQHTRRMLVVEGSPQCGKSFLKNILQELVPTWVYQTVVSISSDFNASAVNYPLHWLEEYPDDRVTGMKLVELLKSLVSLEDGTGNEKFMKRRRVRFNMNIAVASNVPVFAALGEMRSMFFVADYLGEDHIDHLKQLLKVPENVKTLFYFFTAFSDKKWFPSVPLSKLLFFRRQERVFSSATGLNQFFASWLHYDTVTETWKIRVPKIVAAYPNQESNFQLSGTQLVDESNRRQFTIRETRPIKTAVTRQMIRGVKGEEDIFEIGASFLDWFLPGYTRSISDYSIERMLVWEPEEVRRRYDRFHDDLRPSKRYRAADPLPPWRSMPMDQTPGNSRPSP